MKIYTNKRNCLFFSRIDDNDQACFKRMNIEEVAQGRNIRFHLPSLSEYFMSREEVRIPAAEVAKMVAWEDLSDFERASHGNTQPILPRLEKQRAVQAMQALTVSFDSEPEQKAQRAGSSSPVFATAPAFDKNS